MKKNFGIILLAACLTACSSCSKHEDINPTPKPVVTIVTPSPLPPPSVPQEPFVGSTWSLVVPEGFEKIASPNSEIEGFFANKEKKALISVVKEPFAGSAQDYAFLGEQALKRNGINTTNPIVLTVNGQTITLIEGNAEPEDIHAWVWMTVKDGFGYTLSCGGDGDPSQFRGLCTGLFESFKIN